MIETIPQKKIVSFKEVHKELELEAQFVNKDHDILGFKEKADFLTNIGFVDSIATRIYKDISENSETIKLYKDKYPFHKFIFKSQLMRICEKYDLYVRDPEFFIGDIPTKNIDDMRSFMIDPFDVFDIKMYDEKDYEVFKRVEGIFDMYKLNSTKITLKRFFQCLEGLPRINRHDILMSTFDIDDDTKIDFLGDDIRRFLSKSLEIAAVKTMFNPRAFERSEARILNEAELEAKSQVDLDPIVLMKVKGGYLVITAWGDEANDELVVNQTLN